MYFSSQLHSQKVGISFGVCNFIGDLGKQDFSVLLLIIPLKDTALSKLSHVARVCLDHYSSFLTGLPDLSLIIQSISYGHRILAFKIQPGTFNSSSISHHFLRNEVQNAVDQSVFPENSNICLYVPICGFPLYSLNLTCPHPHSPLDAHSAEKPLS